MMIESCLTLPPVPRARDSRVLYFYSHPQAMSIFLGRSFERVEPAVRELSVPGACSPWQEVT
jgi:hypothetical protein